MRDEEGEGFFTIIVTDVPEVLRLFKREHRICPRVLKKSVLLRTNLLWGY